jgi:hypothetical protein
VKGHRAAEFPKAPSRERGLAKDLSSSSAVSGWRDEALKDAHYFRIADNPPIASYFAPRNHFVHQRKTYRELATGWDNRELESSNFRQSPEAALIDFQ